MTVFSYSRQIGHYNLQLNVRTNIKKVSWHSDLQVFRLKLQRRMPKHPVFTRNCVIMIKVFRRFAEARQFDCYEETTKYLRRLQ